MAHDVIISYATSDKSTADAVCAKLEERGIRCWIAPRDILASENYGEAIINAIDSAKVMVLVFSSQANASPHVMREAEGAVRDAIPIIPFRIEDVQPSPSLQYYIGPQHWLDAITPPLEAHILELAETVAILMGKPLSPVAPPEPTTPPRPPRLPVTLSQKKLVLSVVIGLIAVSVISAGYYSSTNNPTPTLSPSAAPATTGADSSGPITYLNTSLGVKFTYPKNWTVGAIPRNNSTSIGNYFWILARRWDDNTTQMYFNIDNKTIFEGNNDSETALNKVNYDIRTSPNNPYWTNFTVVQNPTLVTLGGLPAYEFKYSYNWMTVPGHPAIIAKQIWVTHGDRVYGIIYQGVPDYYNRSLSTADQIINSFQLT